MGRTMSLLWRAASEPFQKTQTILTHIHWSPCMLGRYFLFQRHQLFWQITRRLTWNAGRTMSAMCIWPRSYLEKLSTLWLPMSSLRAWSATSKKIVIEQKSPVALFWTRAKVGLTVAAFWRTGCALVALQVWFWTSFSITHHVPATSSLIVSGVCCAKTTIVHAQRMRQGRIYRLALIVKILVGYSLAANAPALLQLNGILTIRHAQVLLLQIASGLLYAKENPANDAPKNKEQNKCNKFRNAQ